MTAIKLIGEVISNGILFPAQFSKPVARSTASHIKLAFGEGGFSATKLAVAKVLAGRAWDHPSQEASATTNTQVTRVFKNYYLFYCKSLF